jgi:hypothetical protein
MADVDTYLTDNDKYVVLRKDKLPDNGYLTVTGEDNIEHVVMLDAVVQDAVVIRRQDLFASPALATYAQMIAMVAKNIDNKEEAKGLLEIADYFEGQARLAADEGYKFPTL